MRIRPGRAGKLPEWLCVDLFESLVEFAHRFGAVASQPRPEIRRDPAADNGLLNHPKKINGPAEE